MKLNRIIEGKKYGGCVRYKHHADAKRYADNIRKLGYYVRIIKIYVPTRIIEPNISKVTLYEVWSRRITKEDNKMKQKKFNKKLLELVRTSNELPKGCNKINCEECILRTELHPDICTLLKNRIPGHKS